MNTRHIIGGILVGLLLISCPLQSLAHPGKTDYHGGHTNSYTGEYHYHHGYPAHQHPNGVCPYAFDDKTGQGSGTSGESSGTRAKIPAAAAMASTPSVDSTGIFCSAVGGVSAYWLVCRLLKPKE